MHLKRVKRAGGLSCAAVAAAMFFTMPAFANGGDFFEELSTAGAKQNSENGPPYFGVVRDTNGKIVPRAMITLTVKTDGSFLTATADALGHYRLAGLPKNIDIKDVDIDCSKLGMVLVKKDRRRQPGANSPLEVNCIMAAAPKGTAS